MRNFFGTFATNAFAASRATTSRDGFTSVARIDSDESIAIITVASSRATLTVAWGRATPTIIAVSATKSSASGRWRRQPGRASTRFGSRPRFVNRAAVAARRRSYRTYTTTSSGTTTSVASTQGDSKLTGSSGGG